MVLDGFSDCLRLSGQNELVGGNAFTISADDAHVAEDAVVEQRGPRYMGHDGVAQLPDETQVQRRRPRKSYVEALMGVG